MKRIVLCCTGLIMINLSVIGSILLVCSGKINMMLDLMSNRTYNNDLLKNTGIVIWIILALLIIAGIGCIVAGFNVKKDN